MFGLCVLCVLLVVVFSVLVVYGCMLWFYMLVGCVGWYFV